jgi:hypothetical protein
VDKRSNVGKIYFLPFLSAAILLLNVTVIKAEERNKGLSDEPFLSRRTDINGPEKYDAYGEDDRRRRFKDLELMIKQNLMEEYQHLEKDYQESPGD